MQVQLYRSLYDPVAAHSPRFARFQDFAQWLHSSAHEGPKEAAPLWAPQEFWPGAARVKKTENLSRLHALVLDLDDLDVLDWERVVSVALLGREYVTHTTYSHWLAAGRDQLRWRVILSLDRTVTVDEWRPLCERVGAELGIPRMDKRRGSGGLDLRPAATAYFLWSWPEGAREAAWFDYRPGSPLPVDEILARKKSDAARPTVRALRAVAAKMARSRVAARKELGLSLQALASGTAFAAEGSRDDTAFRLAGVLAREFRGAPEQELCAVFNRSLEAMAAVPGAPTREQVTDKIARQCAQVSEEITPSDELRARWRECLRRSGRSEAYSEEELDELAEDLGVDREGLSHSWILQHGPCFYLTTVTGILGPFQKSELPERAEIALAPADTDGVVCQALRAGRVIRQTAADLVAAHGRVLDKVVLSLSRAESALETREGRSVLYLATCPPRAIEARRDELVEKWLELLGGSAVEYLLDWLAAVPRLDLPAQALFLEGASGAGKSLLAQGVARLWSKTGPTSINDLLATHNDPILECPLVFANERIPKDRGIPRLDDLKAEIDQMRRYVNPKYQKKVPLVGAVRVILAANNRELLLQRADLTPDDVEALDVRLIHVPVSSAATEFLEGQDAETITSWVEGDGIAAHVLWLAETRPLRAGRFAVRRAPNPGLRSLATDTGLRAAICHWVVLWLTRRQPGSSGLLRCRDGAIWISARGLHEHWADYDVSVPRVPTISRLSDALRPLSVGRGQATVDGTVVTFEVLDTAVVAGWAERRGFARAEDVRALIAERSA